MREEDRGESVFRDVDEATERYLDSARALARSVEAGRLVTFVRDPPPHWGARRGGDQAVFVSTHPTDQVLLLVGGRPLLTTVTVMGMLSIASGDGATRAPAW